MEPASHTRQPGVTIVTCSIRPRFLEHMFRNYQRQKWANKEWIVVVNSPRANMARYRAMARRLPNIRVFYLPYRSLGKCLNFACARANYSYISKMDDDEYYAARYIEGLMRAFRVSNADVVGKRAMYIHLSGRRVIIQRFTKENQFVKWVAGGTITFKKSVWKKVKFGDVTLGEDVRFLRRCRRLGFKLYAGDKFNFCALRRKNYNSHTWKVSDQKFLAHPNTKVVAYTNDYKSIVDR